MLLARDPEPYTAKGFKKLYKVTRSRAKSMRGMTVVVTISKQKRRLHHRIMHNPNQNHDQKTISDKPAETLGI